MCQSKQSGAVNSSLHTTLSVVEGIRENEEIVPTYCWGELLETQQGSRAFMLQHQL